MSSCDGTERPRLRNQRESKDYDWISSKSFPQGLCRNVELHFYRYAQTPIALICIDSNILPLSLPAKKGVQKGDSQEAYSNSEAISSPSGFRTLDSKEHTDGRSYSCDSEVSRIWNKSHKNISSILFLYILLPNLLSPSAPWRYLFVLNL